MNTCPASNSKTRTGCAGVWDQHEQHLCRVCGKSKERSPAASSEATSGKALKQGEPNEEMSVALLAVLNTLAANRGAGFYTACKQTSANQLPD